MAAQKESKERLTAKAFIADLRSLKGTAGGNNTKYFNDKAEGNKFLDVRMANIFKTAKDYSELPLDEIEKLLDSQYYEVRMGAVSIMDFQARNKNVSEAKKKQLYDLYLQRHECINNWDLVDRSAPFVVGGYLFDKDRKPLYKLAKSKKVMERRTAIVATYYFIRQNQVNDTFKIAELLVNDKHDLINKAVGSWIREAGKRDKQMLVDFLDRFSKTMPRATLRYAVEKLDKSTKAKYKDQ
jgi:3-methyladenine DNA glycosylase AlkD